MTTVDMLIHLHPELSTEIRAKVEKEVRDCNGVITAILIITTSHALIVLYNSDVIPSNKYSMWPDTTILPHPWWDCNFLLWSGFARSALGALITSP